MATKKPQTGLISDVIISLPAEDVSRPAGFSLDIGSSVAKVIYRSNKEYKQGVPIKEGEDPKRGIVHYALFPRTDLNGVIQHLKENCDIKRDENGVAEVVVSGVGGSTFKKAIEKELKVKFTVLAEFYCFVKAFTTLTKIYTKEELVHPPPPKAMAEAANMKVMMEEWLAKAKESGNEINLGTEDQDKECKEEKAEVEEDDNPYLPCLLAMCGSGSGIFMINKDGSHRMLEGPFTGGRFFYGLATWLGGTNNFGKLMEMAEQADGRSVDTYTKDLMKHEKSEGDEEDEANMYNIMNDSDFDMLIFPFGKVVDAQESDVKRADLVHSLYETVATLHMQFACMLLELTKMKSVYFCGNLFNNELGREMILKRKGLRDAYSPPDKHYNMEFVKNGGNLGVLGAFISKPEDKPVVPAAEPEKEIEQHQF